MIKRAHGCFTIPNTYFAPVVTPGHEVTLSVLFAPKKDVEGGKLDMALQIRNIKVFEETYDLCGDIFLECPLKSGEEVYGSKPRRKKETLIIRSSTFRNDIRSTPQRRRRFRQELRPLKCRVNFILSLLFLGLIF